MSSFYDPNKVNFIQSRAGFDEATIVEYARMMEDGVEFDPAEAIQDAGEIYVWDGGHRGEAARRTGKLLLLNVRPGSRLDAEWLSLTANQRHGLRRTQADKQRIIHAALLHPNGAALSDRELGRHCGVHHETVGRIRKELEASGEIRQMETRTVSRGGQTYEVNTANIGSNPGGYVAVWELERGVLKWITGKYTILQGQIETLQAVKERQDEGPALLEELLTGDVLPGPRRKGDVVQACNNVLDQLERRKEQLQVRQLVWQFDPDGKDRCYLCGQAATSYHHREATDLHLCSRCFYKNSPVSGEWHRLSVPEMRAVLDEIKAASAPAPTESLDPQPDSATEEIAELLEAARVKGLDLASYHYCPNCTKRNVDIYPLFPPNTRIRCLCCQRQYKTVAEVRAFLDYQVEAVANVEGAKPAQASVNATALPAPAPPESPAPRALACPRCGSRVKKNPQAPGLACQNCGATWGHMRAYNLERDGANPAPGHRPEPGEKCSTCGKPGHFEKYGTDRRMCFDCWLKSPEFAAASGRDADAEALRSVVADGLTKLFFSGDMAAWGALAYLVVPNELKRTEITSDFCRSVALVVVNAVSKGQGLANDDPASARSRLQGWLEPWGLAGLLPEEEADSAG